MAWMDAISEIVNRYTGAAGGTASASADPHKDFCSVANAAPSQVTADALALATAAVRERAPRRCQNTRPHRRVCSRPPWSDNA